MNISISCKRCGKSSGLYARFCSLCGNPLFVSLSINNLHDDMFLDVLNSLYNLITTNDAPDRDRYFHTVSRNLINQRFKQDHRLEMEAASRKLFSLSSNRTIKEMEVINMRIASRSSNTLTGYATRGVEELITKRKTPSLSREEIEEGINLFLRLYEAEYPVVDIANHMSDENIRERILFTFFLQDENKHMKYFLNESLLKEWFETILDTNIGSTLERYKQSAHNLGTHGNFKDDEIAEEVLNDMVFGYCIKLSESLFPVGAGR